MFALTFHNPLAILSLSIYFACDLSLEEARHLFAQVLTANGSVKKH